MLATLDIGDIAPINSEKADMDQSRACKTMSTFDGKSSTRGVGHALTRSLACDDCRFSTTLWKHSNTTRDNQQSQTKRKEAKGISAGGLVDSSKTSQKQRFVAICHHRSAI